MTFGPALIGVIFGCPNTAFCKNVARTGLIYSMAMWQGFLNVILTIPCTGLEGRFD